MQLCRLHPQSGGERDSQAPQCGGVLLLPLPDFGKPDSRACQAQHLGKATWICLQELVRSECARLPGVGSGALRTRLLDS